MKIKVKIVLLLANMMVLGTVLTGCGQISVSAKQVQIELGGEVPSDLSDYVYMVDLVDGTSYIEPLLCSWEKVSFIKLDGIFDVFLGLVCI